MGYQNRLAYLGLPVTLVAVYVLQSWSSSSNAEYSFSPVKPSELAGAAQRYRKNTSSLHITRDPASNEYATESLSQDGDQILVGPRTTNPGYVGIFESTSKSAPEQQDSNSGGQRTSTRVMANTTESSSDGGQRTSTRRLSNTTESSPKSSPAHSAPDQTVEHVPAQSALSGKPRRGAGFEELHSRYRACMGRLVSLALEGRKGPPLDEPTPYEGLGDLLVGEGWRAVAGRLASVKKGCRIPAVEFTGAPTLADVIFDKTHHLAYCRHGKAGTTSLLSFLLWLNHVDPTSLTTNLLHRRIFTELPMPTHESQRDLLERSFSFTAVRHPFRRLVSAYCDKEVEKKLEILPHEIRIMSPDERVVELLKYDYKVKSSAIEPAVLAGNWIRRVVTDSSLPLGGPEDGSLLAHYLSGVASNLTPKENLIEPTTDIQEVHFEGGRNETALNVSSAEPFRMFVHGVALTLLDCGSDTSCLGLTDRHIKPQVIRWNPCVLNFDMIMKVETLDRDVELLKDLLGLPDPLVEGGGNPIGRTEGNLNPGRVQKKLRSMTTGPRSDDMRSEKRIGEETPTHKEIDSFVTSESQVGNRNIAGNADKSSNPGDGVPKIAPKAHSKHRRASGFFKRNTSGKKCGTYEENMKQLSPRDIDLLYTSYYWDFKLFRYEPFD